MNQSPYLCVLMVRGLMIVECIDIPPGLSNLRTVRKREPPADVPPSFLTAALG
jgi:hypothetical protein